MVAIYPQNYKNQLKHPITKIAAANIPQNIRSGVKFANNN